MSDMNQPNLAGTFWRLFQQANSFRETCGGAHDLRTSCARQMLATQDEVGERAEVELPDNMARPTPYCGCDPEVGQSCDVCETILPGVCTINQTMDWCKQHDVFDGLAHMLAMVKISDYTAAAESFYAPVGNKPAELKANPVVEVPEAEMQTAAGVFYEYIQKFLDDNQVTIDEIPAAFNLGAMNDLVDELSRTAKEQLQQEIQEGLDKAEGMMESAFNRADLMSDYLKVIDDTSHAPIGVLWYDHSSLQKDFKAGSGGLKTVYELQPNSQRVDPQKIWFTPDWTEDHSGRAVFTTRQLSAGDLLRIREYVPTPSRANIDDLLENNECGYRMYSAHLFYDTMTTEDGLYDILVGRGMFMADELTEAGLTLPNGKDKMHQAEVWYAGGEVLHAQLIPDYIDNYGVYTTNFRTFGNNIWGISLYDFVIPFAKMYEGAIRGIDSSVAKTSGSIISMDVGVIENPESYITRNPKTGTYEMDLSGDTIIQFDSTDAMVSPNWKGVPIQINQLPTDLPNLAPAIEIALQQIEIISGIPRIISTGNPDSSAVRTDSSYRTAHRSASKKIASLLKRSKDRVLTKIIMAFYRTLVDSGLLKGMPIDVEPELLMDERLTNDVQSAQSAGLILQDLAPFMDRIPATTVNSIINGYIRNVHGVQYDVIPGANPVGNETPAQQTGDI